LEDEPIAETVAGDETLPSPPSPVSPDLQETVVPEFSADLSPEAPALQPQPEDLSADVPVAISPEAPASQPQPETPAADSGADVPAEASTRIPSLQPQLEAPLTEAITDTTPKVPTLPEPPHPQPQLEVPLPGSTADTPPEVPTLQPEGNRPSAEIAADVSTETLSEFPGLQPPIEAPLTDSPGDTTPESPTLQPQVDPPADDSPGVLTETATEPPSLQPQVEAPLADSPADIAPESPTLHPLPEAPTADSTAAYPEPFIQPQSQTTDVEVPVLENSDAQTVPEGDLADTAPVPNLLSPFPDAELAPVPQPAPSEEPVPASPLETDDITQLSLQRATEPESAGTEPTHQPEVTLQTELQETVSADELPLTETSADEPAAFNAGEEESITAAYQTEGPAFHETFSPTIPGERPPNLQPSDLPTSPSEQTFSPEPTATDTESFSAEPPSLQAFTDSQATDAPGIPLQRAEQRETTTAAEEPQTEVPQPENQGSDLVEQATPKLPASQNSVLQARQQEPWQDQFKLEPGPSPSSLKPWRQQFQLDAPVEQLSSSDPPAISSKEDAAAAETVSHQLISPIARPEQSEPGESAQVSDQQLEQLAHICYGLARSHLLTCQELHYGINNLGPSWADVSFLPSLAAKPDSETQISMDAKALELDALSLAWDKNISELCQEVQSSLQFRMTLERDRSPGKAFTRLGR
jgi:hypothetical protein